ncbi:hypothetical protein XELAEV_18021825mg [Xenopus laevis]|uniref:Uncharacterized protein n=1 Tax=Xenopus laevis TaxID=8355 RepID=A0A974D232_XENLA|nr:hypothetical protein XELAEV_18021825mg [Xenopus laevis]
MQVSHLTPMKRLINSFHSPMPCLLETITPPKPPDPSEFTFYPFSSQSMSKDIYLLCPQSPRRGTCPLCPPVRKSLQPVSLLIPLLPLNSFLIFSLSFSGFNKKQNQMGFPFCQSCCGIGMGILRDSLPGAQTVPLSWGTQIP